MPLNANTTVDLIQMPPVDFDIDRSYVFRDIKPIKNSLGYSDLVGSTDYPLLEAKLSNFFYDQRCTPQDFYSFVGKYKASRAPFLFLDTFNSVLKERQNEQIEMYTTIEFETTGVYRLFQNYNYNGAVVKKPISYFQIEELVINGTVQTIDNNAIISVINNSSGIINYKIRGKFFTVVKIKDGKEIENLNRNLRSVSELVLYEYTILTVDNSSIILDPL
jgi:hypothetical protein